MLTEHPGTGTPADMHTGADPSSVRFRQRWGLLAALRRALVRYLLQTLGLRLNGIYLRQLSAPVGPDPSLPGFDVRLFTRDDVDSLLACAQRPELGLTENFVRNALGKGDVCAAVLVDRQIVSFIWSAFTPTHDHDGVFVDFDNRQRYGYFAFTLPEYRGRHLPRLLYPPRDRYCLARGRSQGIAFVAAGNQSSIRMTSTGGSSRIGYAGYLKCGPLFIPFRSRAVREQGFRFFMPKGRPAGQEQA